MGVGDHVIGGGRLRQGVQHAGPVHADFDADRLATTEQPVHVLVEKGPLAVIQPHALPHAVAQHET